ncbi:AraC family transcriptional regulator [Hufsiella ginkgonis]|uniref:Helix-turn-helix domain-containing protein n=1 Tax=Hufsiella ginkgonis TaxID=2695274 RepID=A0A7K1Y0P5_9SPHI|nr:AraC family transcriptional regulator [Hufsiella ginkgonis]MXV16782.1 helix-turn-helix domain-containing protein [Hufsiella ginkgonis]
MINSIAKSAIPESKLFVVKKTIAPFFDRTFHFHPEYQLFLVLKGHGSRFVGDNIKSFAKGDMVLTGPNLPHVWRSDAEHTGGGQAAGTEGIVIYFNEDFLSESVLGKEEMDGIRHLFQKASRGLEIAGKTNRVVAKMMEELLQSKGAKSIIKLLTILDTLACSSDCHPITHTRYVTISKQAETDRMNGVYEYVLKNFREKIDLAAVAALCNMTPTSFSRYFKSRVNKSFSDFLQEMRIDHACKLLHGEKTPINRVAYDCGYQTLSNFNKQFKKTMGQTPQQYKSEYLQVNIDTFGDF